MSARVFSERILERSSPWVFTFYISIGKYGWEVGTFDVMSSCCVAYCSVPRANDICQRLPLTLTELRALVGEVFKLQRLGFSLSFISRKI